MIMLILSYIRTRLGELVLGLIARDNGVRVSGRRRGLRVAG